MTLDRPILMVARRALAEWQLRRMIEAGARLESVAVTLVDRDRRGGWVVGARDGRRWRVRRLVGADGAASRTRAAAAPTLRIGLEPTRVAYPTVAGSTDGTAVIRFFPGVEGYAWIFPRADHFSIGMVAVGEGWRRERLDAEVGRLAAGSLDGDMPRMPRAGAVIGSALHSLSTSVESLSGPDFALLGDAAGLADPASGEGIRNALRSAEFLSEAYAIDGTFARYGRIVVERLEPGFRRARLERRLMYDLGFAARLVRAATRSSLALALGKALVDAANEPGQGWIRRWLRGWWLASRPSA